MAKSKKKRVGRPTKYRQRYGQKLIDFFDAEPYEEREIPHYKSGEWVWTDYKRLPNKLPTLRDFAKKINVGVRTVYEWKDPNSGSYQEEFSRAFTLAKELRKWFIIQNGLQSHYNPLFAKFVACNITDMTDVKEHDLGDKTLNSLVDIAAIFASGGYAKNKRTD